MLQSVSSMKFMRRLFYLIFVGILAVSCFGDGPTYQSSYTLEAGFEYSFDYPSTFRPDSLWFDVAAGSGIRCNDLAFFHKLNADKTEVIGGFMASYQEMPKSPKVEEDTDEETEENEGQSSESENPEESEESQEPKEVIKTYRAYLKTPGTVRNTYLVFRDSDNMPEHDMWFLMNEYGTCVMENCLVTNTLEVAEAIAANFEKGDKLVLKATGWHNGASTGKAEISLADFSSQKDSIVSKWTQFDLSDLGAVEYVDFEVEVQSAKTNMEIPTYFCIDNVKASINVSY